MKSTKLTIALTTGWVWIYNHLIQHPQAVVDLYEAEIDDINNALQCPFCGGIFLAANISCPGCHESGQVEMVFAPGQEPSDFHPVDPPITPEEHAHVLEVREWVTAAQEWEAEKATHDPAACGKFTDCEYCAEIEHDRMIADGEITCD